MTEKTRIRRIGPPKTGDVVLAFGEHDLRLARTPILRLTAYEVRAAYRALYSGSRKRARGKSR